jgi:CRP-like cAMP-binding protein
MYDTLSKSKLFAGFPKEQIELIFKEIHYRVRKHQKGELIFLAGDKIDSLMILLEGTISGEMVDGSGHVFRIENIHSGMTIAPGFIFGIYNHFPVNVVAVKSCKILSISKNDLIILMNKYPQLSINLTGIISNKTQFLALKIKSIFMQTIRGKIAVYLLDMSNSRNSREFEMDTSQTELARKFNVARPSVARVFSKMKSKGIIEVKRRKVKILDEIQLRNCINRI